MPRRAEDASDQVVVVGQVLASEVNIGFEGIVNTSVLRINDKPVTNLRQVCTTKRNPEPSSVELLLMMIKNAYPHRADLLRSHRVDGSQVSPVELTQ